MQAQTESTKQPQRGAHLPPQKRRHHRRRIGIKISIIALLLAGLYCFAVFSQVPFVKKWRDIYIETAMGTMTHQWLATAFIPDSVIDEVMDTRSDIENKQESIETNWTVEAPHEHTEKTDWTQLKEKFFALYPEIDRDSFNRYFDSHAEECLTEDGYLLIDKAGLDDESTGIKSIHGDEVLAIDTVNGITILKVAGDEYVGRLAIIKDPAQVGMGLSWNFGQSGTIISQIAQGSGAVLAINASGFYDPEGQGNGGTPHGLVIKDGQQLWDWVDQPGERVIGFDTDNQLNLGSYAYSSSYRDAVQFSPVLILDGEKLISGSSGWGMQPRSAIGQTKDGQVLMLVVDGRQPGYSVGCTMGDLADILSRYGAQQACNLDGGSSSIMYYNGRRISRPSGGDKENGRLLPNAWIVKPR
ncbi:MAG: phosphodiester glycosidase family protein [Candidatus Heteroscillospira sp.]